ncbi:hypothetical protein [Hyalangium versicolor]|uniref:hypothetical protein n=1 Tax=Hyalangium versicolor TaxID=2861190 RepID=UPI001CCB5ADF|nr:hypothetical protein [Hyalangium versicolor]
MLERSKALKALMKAISAVKALDEPEQIEPVLDAVASSLRPFFQDLPDKLKDGAVPLDALLAYLSSENWVSPRTAKAASRLLERASIERYDGTVVEAPVDEVNTKDRDLLFDGLKKLHTSIEFDEPEPDDDEEGA